MRINSIFLAGCCLVLAAIMCAAAPLIAAGADDQIRHIFVTKTEPLSSSAMRLDEKSQAIKDQFLADTVKIRRALAGKQAALQAVYSARSGNTAAASRLGEEIFDLREQLRLKIQTTGLTPALLLDLSIPTCPEENQP